MLCLQGGQTGKKIKDLFSCGMFDLIVRLGFVSFRRYTDSPRLVLCFIIIFLRTTGELRLQMILCDWRKAMPFPKPCEGQVSCMRLCHHGGLGSGRSLPVFADCCYSWLKFRASPYSGKVTNNPCICVCEGMVLFPATTVGAYYAVSSQGVGECPHSRRADLPVSAVALPVVSEFCCYAPTIVY